MGSVELHWVALWLPYVYMWNGAQAKSAISFTMTSRDQSLAVWIIHTDVCSITTRDIDHFDVLFRYNSTFCPD
jgi:hypothetical protein